MAEAPVPAVRRVRRNFGLQRPVAVKTEGNMYNKRLHIYNHIYYIYIYICTVYVIYMILLVKFSEGIVNQNVFMYVYVST